MLFISFRFSFYSALRAQIINEPTHLPPHSVYITSRHHTTIPYQVLEDTVDNVHRIMASQADLKAACETIEAYQNELDADLSSLAANLDLEMEALQLQVRYMCVVYCGVLCCIVLLCMQVFVWGWLSVPSMHESITHTHTLTSTVHNQLNH